MQKLKNALLGRIPGRGKSVLLGYLISYMIVITIIFVVIGGYSYANIVRGNRDRNMAELGNTVSEYMTNLDDGLRNAMEVSSSLYNHLEVSRLRKLPRSLLPSDYIRFQELSRTLALSTNPFIERITLYFHNNHIFISSDMVENRPNVYYTIRPFNSATHYEQWREEQTARRPGSIYVADEPVGRSVNLYYRLPYIDDATGVTAISTLNVANILESYGFVGGYQRAAMILTDAEGKAIYSGGSMAAELSGLVVGLTPTPELEHGGVNYQWYSEASAVTGWRINFLVDRRELYANILEVQGDLFAVYFTVLAVALLLAVIFAKGISDPVASILRLVGNDGGEGAEGGEGEKDGASMVWRHINGNRLRYVLQKVSDISADKNQLIRQVKDYREASREVFLFKLLSGDAMLPEEIALGQEGDMAIFEYTCFTVAIAQLLLPDLDGQDDDAEDPALALNAAMRITLDSLSAMNSGGVYFRRLSDDRVAVILCGSAPPSRSELTAPLSALTDAVLSRTGVDIHWGVGVTVRNTDQIFVSGQNATYVICNTDIRKRDRFVWYDDVRSRQSAKLSYGMENEQRLINAMSGGDAETAKKIISEAVERSLPLLSSSGAQQRQFVSAFTETAYRMENLIADVGIEEEKELRLYLWQMKNAHDPDTIRNYLFMIADFFCGIVSRRSENRSHKLMESICDYIGVEYGDAGLCLTSVAKHFSMSENYLSTFFKQSSGMNISQYIEKLRMSFAAKMLAEGGLGTTLIAEKCGYSNANTFYKAFKRYYGVNPKTYREGGKALENVAVLTAEE